jgi:hypothetical protein
MVTFLMLNPSTADEIENDPTIRRCIGFAQRWDAGGMFVANIFALRSTDPNGLLDVVDPVGRGNNDHIANMASASRVTICAWGSHSGGRLKRLIATRAAAVLGVLRKRDIMCLGTAKDGSPRHPLYLKADTSLVRWPR